MSWYRICCSSQYLRGSTLSKKKCLLHLVNVVARVVAGVLHFRASSPARPISPEVVLELVVGELQQEFKEHIHSPDDALSLQNR